jgi:hypothetical protein
MSIAFCQGPVRQYQSADQAISACFLFQRATVCGDILDLAFDLDDVLLGLLARHVFFFDTPVILLSVTYDESNSVSWQTSSTELMALQG